MTPYERQEQLKQRSQRLRYLGGTAAILCTLVSIWSPLHWQLAATAAAAFGLLGSVN